MDLFNLTHVELSGRAEGAESLELELVEEVEDRGGKGPSFFPF